MNGIRFLQIICILMLSSYSFGQSIDITGVVTSSFDNQPIIGANVTVKGSGDLGTITEVDGSYKITVDDGEELVLVFSYIGMATKEVVVGGRTVVDVVMDVEASLINEIVVVGYGTEKRSSINAAVAVVTAEEISSTPALRVEQALQGRAAGVVVAQNSGSPGSTLSVNIRGINSLGSSEPLYVVDGIPVDGLDFLNTADIETISILKDAAAAGIYGTRGANGVVLITTKSGNYEKEGRISYEGYQGVQSPWKKLNLLNAREYAIIQNESFIAAGKVPRPEFANPNALGVGTDWQDAVFANAPIGSHSVRMTGGSKKSSYSLSGGYFQQDGIVGGEKARFKRYTARLATEYKVKDWLTVGTNVGFTNLERNAINENNEFSTPLVHTLNMDPVTPVRKEDGTYAYSKYADTDIANPVNQIELTYDTWTSNRVVGALYGVLDFTSDLSLRTSYSIDATFATQDIFVPRFNLSNDVDLRDAPDHEIRDENSVAINHNTWKSSQVENVLTYKKLIEGKHQITVDMGNSVLQRRYHTAGASNTNLPSNDPDDAYIGNTIDPLESQGASEFAEEESLLSYFGRVNYNFDEKYFITAIMRADGSSKFGPDNRFGYFPSFSLGWLITEEEWNLGPVSYLKLRSGWGKNGNDRIGNNRYRTVVSSGQNYTYSPDETIVNGSVPLAVGNSELRWEETNQFNVGLDAEFLNGRISLTTDYFIKNTNDMLYESPIPLTVGAQPPTQNVASMRNKGWEFAANYKDKVAGFSYDFGGNITFINNEVTDLGLGSEPIVDGDIPQQGFATLTDIGQPIGSFYGYITDGIFQNGEEVAAHAFQNSATAPGDIRFKDLNNDGVIDEEDRTYIGNPNPDFSYGITANFKYAGVDLGIFLQGVSGNDIFNATVRYDLPFSNKPNSILDRWTGEGTSNNEPRVSLNDPNFNSRISDRFIEDGSYLRLKNIQIGYTLPEYLLERMKMDKMRIYMSSNNLFTFTKYTGLDPEIGAYGGALSAGIDRGFYPQAKSFIFGLQLTF